jgi:hypothetical protein
MNCGLKILSSHKLQYLFIQREHKENLSLSTKQMRLGN